MNQPLIEFFTNQLTEVRASMEQFDWTSYLSTHELRRMSELAEKVSMLALALAEEKEND